MLEMSDFGGRWLLGNICNCAEFVPNLEFVDTDRFFVLTKDNQTCKHLNGPYL